MRQAVQQLLTSLWQRREKQSDSVAAQAPTAHFLQDQAQLTRIAQQVGKDWNGDSPVANAYYNSAEQWMDEAWQHTIWPVILNCDFSCVVDLAAGHGRNSQKLLDVATKLYVIDINPENIQFCQARFAGKQNVIYLCNDGFSLVEVPSNEVTLIYCFDAMIHFDSDVVRSYLHDFYRVLKPGGHGFCHYSNYDKNPCGHPRDNPGWKNFMSENLFLHYCTKEGLEIVRSRVFDNGTTEQQDCLTLFRKPVAG